MLVEDLSTENLNLGFAYQTLCHGSTLIDDWENLKIDEVNGATGENMYGLMAPIILCKSLIEVKVLKNL